MDHPEYTLYRCNDCGQWHETPEDMLSCECLDYGDLDPELPAMQDAGEDLCGGFTEYPW